MKSFFFDKLSRYVRLYDFSNYGTYVQHTLFTYDRFDKCYTTYVTIKTNYLYNSEHNGRSHLTQEECYTRLKVNLYTRNLYIEDVEITSLCT